MVDQLEPIVPEVAERLQADLEDAAEDWRAAPSLSSRRSGSVRQATRWRRNQGAAAQAAAP